MDPWYGEEQQPNETAFVLMRQLVEYFASDRCVVQPHAIMLTISTYYVLLGAGVGQAVHTWQVGRYAEEENSSGG